MRPGTLIDYRLRFRGFPLRWRSEITAWDPPHRFADAQVKGPYRQWIHEHSFVEQERRDAGGGPGGIRCVGRRTGQLAGGASGRGTHL